MWSGPARSPPPQPPGKRRAQRRDQVREAFGRDLEAARYAADRAFRQYDAADPANRLVAGELEARWNSALTHVAEVEAKIAAHDAAMPAAAVEPLALGLLASNLKTVWFAPTTDARLKKRIVRTIIHEVVADVDDAAAEIVLAVHWVGGVHSEICLPKRRRGQRNSTSADVITAVRQLVLIVNDDLIAGILNRNGLKTGNGHRWTRERVTSMRSNYRIPVFKPAERGIEPWLNLSSAAKLLRIALRRCGLPRKPERSRQSILSRTDHGSSLALRSLQQPPDRLPNGHDRTRNIPRDRIPTNKASSLQRHSQMGVVMRDCLGYLTPNEFVAQGATPAPRQATGRDAAVLGASAPRPVAQPSRRGQMQQAREAVSS